MCLLRFGIVLEQCCRQTALELGSVKADTEVEHLKSLQMTPAIVLKVEQIQTVPGLHATALALDQIQMMMPLKKLQISTTQELQTTTALEQIQISLDSWAHYLEDMRLVWQMDYHILVMLLPCPVTS